MFTGQARNVNSPFEIVDLSIKEAIESNWKENARRRIKGCDVVIVLCGEHMHTASGVAAEIKISKEEGIPYFLLKGYRNRICTKPANTEITDKIHQWTWANLGSLINGNAQYSQISSAKSSPSKKPAANKSSARKTTQNKTAQNKAKQTGTTTRKKTVSSTASNKSPARKTSSNQTKGKGNKSFANMLVSLLFGNK